MRNVIRKVILLLLLTTFCFQIQTAKAEIPSDVGEPSLFFTQEEMEKIYSANDGLVSSGDAGRGNDAQVSAPVDPGPRILKLTGILYRGSNDWVIWFNGERVTAKNKPDRMMDILVRQDRIAIKWLDRGTNRIINLVLRPHQEYHIDTDTITMGTER